MDLGLLQRCAHGCCRGIFRYLSLCDLLLLASRREGGLLRLFDVGLCRRRISSVGGIGVVAGGVNLRLRARRLS